MTAAPPPRGSAGQRIISSLRSSSSSSVSTRATPAWVTSARIMSWSPVMAPVWVCAEARAAALRPGCSMTIGLPAARARAASARKRCGSRIWSAIIVITSVASRVDQVIDEILDAVDRLVAGGDRVRDRDVARPQGGVQHRRHGAALRHDADLAAAVERLGRGGSEGQRDAIDVVDEAEAVRPFDRDAVVAGDARDLVLQRAAVRARLGEAGRKDDDGADAARRATLDRVEDAGARDRQHRAIHALRQVGGRGQAGPPVDLLAVGVDQMDVARERKAIEIAEHGAGERARRGGCSDHRDRARMQQALDRRPAGPRRLSHRAGIRRGRAESSSRRGTG